MDKYAGNMIISYVFRTLSLKIHQFTKRTHKVIKLMKWNFSCHFPGHRLDRIKWSDHNESHSYDKILTFFPLVEINRGKLNWWQIKTSVKLSDLFTPIFKPPMVENVICRCVMSAGIDDIYSNASIWWYPAFDCDQIERRSAMHLRFFRSYIVWMPCAYITVECKINVCVQLGMCIAHSVSVSKTAEDSVFFRCFFSAKLM